MDLSASNVTIQINDEPRTVRQGQALDDLVASLGLPPQTALVEYNGRALLRSEWSACRLAEGDRLEILRVVAGG